MRPSFLDLSNPKTLLLVLLSLGIASGLTVGLIGLDYTTLEVLSKSGTPKEQAAAKKILPIVNNHHLLLVTLLLATASAEEAMPLFLERMMPAWASIIVSVILVLIFAEVVPMALCTRYGLEIGSKMAWVVQVFIVIAYPIAFPISKGLDYLFGHTAGTLFKRSQLKELINMHSKHSIQTAADVEAELKKLPAEERLTSHEVQLIKNALDLNARLAIEISTPIDDVYMLEFDQICDREVIGSIVHYGLHYSVPVYKDNRDNIVGVIRVGDLISLSPDDNTPISELQLDPIPKIPSDTPVYHALTKLQIQKSQLAILVDPQLTRIPVAVLTLDDIVEELVEGQISIDYPLFASQQGENVLGEWLGGEDYDLHLEVASNSSAFSTASMPTRPRPSYIEHSIRRDRSFNPDMVHLDDDMGFRARASSFSSNATVPFAMPSTSPTNAASSSSAANRLVPFGTLSPQRATQYELDHATEIHNDLISRSGSIAPPSPQWSGPILHASSSSASLPVRPTTKLIPFPVISPQQDHETASVGSDAGWGRYRLDSASSVASDYSAHTAPTDDFLSQAGSEASSTSASTAPAHLSIRRRKPKDPNTSQQVAQRLTVASVVATALKRSTSSLSINSPVALRPLPTIYKRNIQGEAVVDPSKLLSASYGDLPNLGETVNEMTLPPIRTLSASHDDIGSPDEEQVALDW